MTGESGLGWMSDVRSIIWYCFFFFFRAEDGIRDADVTGVQTCALPIWPNPYLIYSPTDLNHNAVTLPASAATAPTTIIRASGVTKMTYFLNCTQAVKLTMTVYSADDRSEERRVGEGSKSGMDLASQRHI